jgi:hypothetical protein
MKVRELIALLKECNPDREVFVWVDGDRYPTHSVDGNFDDNLIDINADTRESK